MWGSLTFFFFHSDFTYGSQTFEIIFIPKLGHNEMRIFKAALKKIVFESYLHEHFIYMDPSFPSLILKFYILKRIYTHLSSEQHTPKI